MKYECAFVYGDGTREAFTIHDPDAPGEMCRVEGGRRMQSAFTPGASLTNSFDFFRWTHGLDIVEVHAPAAVLVEARKHAARPPAMLASMDFNGRTQWSGSGVIHPEPHHPAGTETKSYHPRYAGR